MDHGRRGHGGPPSLVVAPGRAGPLASAEWLSDSRRWRPDVRLVAHAANDFDCPPSWRLEERVKPTYQIWLVTGGCATLSVEDRRCDVAEGSFVLVRAGVPHSGWHDAARPLQCYVLHFVAYVHDQPSAMVWPSFAMSGLGEPTWGRLVTAAATLKEEVAGGAAGVAGADLLGSAAVGQLLGLVERAADQGVEVRQLERRDQTPAAVQRVVDYVNLHYADDVSVEKLSDVAALSPGHLGHLVRRYLGASPQQYVRTRRMAAARHLLSETELPMRAVAAACGYRDAFYFSRVFRRAIGMTPSRYRQVTRGDATP